MYIARINTALMLDSRSKKAEELFSQIDTLPDGKITYGKKLKEPISGRIVYLMDTKSELCIWADKLIQDYCDKNKIVGKKIPKENLDDFLTVNNIEFFGSFEYFNRENYHQYLLRRYASNEERYGVKPFVDDQAVDALEVAWRAREIFEPYLDKEEAKQTLEVHEKIKKGEQTDDTRDFFHENSTVPLKVENGNISKEEFTVMYGANTILQPNLQVFSWVKFLDDHNLSGKYYDDFRRDWSSLLDL